MLWLSHQFSNMYRWHFNLIKPKYSTTKQNGKTPKWVLFYSTQKRRKVLCSPWFGYFMVSFLWSIRVKTIENCRRCPFYNSTVRWEKWLRHDKPWINSGDQLQMVEKFLLLTSINYKSSIANYKPWLQVVGDIIFDVTVHNIWLAITRDKQCKWISEKRLSAVNIKDEVFTAICL